MNIGERLKKFRLKLAVSQEQFAKYLRISPKAYWNYENNVRQLPLKIVIKIAKLCNINLHFLLLGEGEIFRDK